MTGGLANTWAGSSGPEPEKEESSDSGEDLDEIKKQLAELQKKLSKLK